MGIFDWLRSSEPEPISPAGMSRRDFFARVAGQGAAPGSTAGEAEEDTGALYTFHVSRFPYHDGPILVPILRPGLDFLLIPDANHPTDPTAVKIQWGKDHLGYVPPEHSADIRQRLAAGETLRCTSVSVDPAGELARVLKVEIRLAEEELDEDELEEVEPGAETAAEEAQGSADAGA